MPKNLFILFFLLTAFNIFADDHVDIIDPSIHHQTIDNFGASDCWTFQKIGVWSDENKNRVADLLFTVDKGIGLSCWRFNIGGGINPNIRNNWRTAETFEVSEGKYDWSRQANERWFAKAAQARQVPYLLGFVNSPPARMTQNGLTNHGTDNTNSTNLKEGFETPFATYLCDIVDHFKNAPESERLLFNYLSPINEPAIAWLNSKNQEGCRYSNEDAKKVIAALHSEIAKRKLDVKVIAPETSSIYDVTAPNKEAQTNWNKLYGNYLADFVDDKTFAPNLDGVLCYHDYSAYKGDAVEKSHRDLGKALEKYPGLKVWMSEICFLENRRDLTINWAIDLAKLIHADLALSNASAWQFWLAMSNGDYKDGLLYTTWQRPGNPENIMISKAFWALGNYSRFIRPGFVRVDLTSPTHNFNTLLASAYQDEKTKKLVLVYINPSTTPQNIHWTFKTPEKPAKFTPWLTTESEDLAKHDPIDPANGYTLPPRSIATFVSEN